jgi:para-nitrobenzyl esterase
MYSISSLHFLALFFSTIPSCLSLSVPIIQTTSGKLQGIAVSNTTNAYLGIPYAVPPVGQLRFLAPRPLLTPQVTRDTTSFGPACVQPPTLEIPSGQSEDCLSLNVWTSPNSPGRSQKKPVFVWIHGGGWTTGAVSWTCKYFR